MAKTKQKDALTSEDQIRQFLDNKENKYYTLKYI